MRFKYISLLIASILFLFVIGSCSDDNKTVDIPDAPEQIKPGSEDEDDGVVAEPTTDARIQIKFSEKHQEIDGFGTAIAGWSDRLYANTVRDKVVDRLFSKSGLDLSFYRGKIHDIYEYVENTTKINFGWDKVYNVPADHPSIVNNYWNETNDREERGQMWLLDYLNKQYPNVRIYHAAWSPPAMMKANGNVIGGSIIDTPEKLTEYAKFIVDFIEGQHKVTGTYPYAISPTNEPNAALGGWSGCRWTPVKLADFIVDYLRPIMNANGHQDVAIILGEHSWWNSGGVYVADMLRARPELANLNTIAGGHGYVFYSGMKPYTAAIEAGLKVWNTETSNTNTYDGSWKDGMWWANQFHTYLDAARVNALIWWAGARPASNNESLIRLEEAIPGTFYYKPEPMRYYVFGQFTKHISIGSYRVGVERLVDGQVEGAEPSASQIFLDKLQITAYHDASNDQFTVVIINQSETESKEVIIDLEDLGISNMQLHGSTSEYQWKKEKVNPSETTASRYVDIPAFSVTTITGKATVDNAE